ncbi:minor capsid protein [Microviridae sp.]|nr:minor capsid protein [Microviridae sp.]
MWYKIIQHKLDMFSDIASAASPAALISNVASNLGISYMNMRATNERADRNEANAWDMYQTQREDSNTVHQREAEDLKKAGFNPMLTVMGKGNPVATGSAPTMQAGQIQAPDLLYMLQQMANIKKTNAEADILSPKANINNKVNQGINSMNNILGEAYDYWLNKFQQHLENQRDNKGPNIPKNNTGEDYSRDYFRGEKNIPTLYNHNGR